MTDTRIILEEGETAKLMRAAARYAPLAISFGSGVWLQRDRDGKIISAWALPLLSEWRGVTVSEGLGI